MAETYEQQPSQPMTAEGRYSQLETQRSPALTRARDAAELTIPALLPRESASDATELYTPFQSVGARGVNNLAAKLLLALFPPGSSFFRLTVDAFALDELVKDNEEVRQEIESALAKVERAVNTRLEQKAARPILSEAFKHLIVTGNGLLQILKSGSMKFHSLACYVVKRDAVGEPVEIIVREGLSRKTLPPAAAAIVAAESDGKEDKDTTDIIYLYTWIRRQENGSQKVHQEICGKPIPGTEGTYAAGKSAWLPLRWQRVVGMDYGRGHAEEYIGDLRSLESLSQAIVDFAANAAKVVWLVDEGGVTMKSKLEKAPSGAVIDGNKKDVTTLSMEKFPDFQVVKATANDIEHRLEQAFLLNSSIQRQAERVTAEEIRFMAGELEQALGGTYSVLAAELQHPLVVRLMAVMQKAGELPHLPEKLVSPQIVTGLDGLGRSSNVMKLDLLLAGVAQTFGPEAVEEYVSVGVYIQQKADALALEIDNGLIRTEEEVQKARQQRAQQALLEKAVPPGIKAMSDQALAAQQPPAGAAQ